MTEISLSAYMQALLVNTRAAFDSLFSRLEDLDRRLAALERIEESRGPSS